MTDDELRAAFARFTDPEWLATVPSYIDTARLATCTYRKMQHRRYREAMAQSRHDAAQLVVALDALWKAASEADMLTPQEQSYTDLTSARITELLTALGWE